MYMLVMKLMAMEVVPKKVMAMEVMPHESDDNGSGANESDGCEVDGNEIDGSESGGEAVKTPYWKTPGCAPYHEPISESDRSRQLFYIHSSLLPVRLSNLHRVFESRHLGLDR